MRCLLAFSILALLACNPAIVAHDTADTSSLDDSGALYPWYTGDDGADDDADPTRDPFRDAGPIRPGARKLRFHRGRHAESPQITPIEGVVGMRLQSVVVERFVAQTGPDQGLAPWRATAKER